MSFYTFCLIEELYLKMQLLWQLILFLRGGGRGGIVLVPPNVFKQVSWEVMDNFYLIFILYSYLFFEVLPMIPMFQWFEFFYCNI